MTMQSYADSGMAASLCHPLFRPRSGPGVHPPGWWVGANGARGSPLRAVGSTFYTWDLDKGRGVALIARFETRRSQVTDYALVLVVDVGGGPETVRVYDAAHGC